MRPARQPSSLSRPTLWFKREFAAPDPADRGACARFRMRRKAFKASSRRPSPATVLQLQQTKLEFYHRLNSLNKTVLQQAHAFSEHLASCTSMVNNLANLTRIGPASVHHSQPFHHEDPAAPDQNSTSTNSPPCIPASHGLLSRSQFAHPSSSHTEAMLQSRDNSSSTKSVSTTLPRLRGYFNKPKQKLEHDRCG